MGWTKSICKVLQNATRRQSIQPAVAPTSIERVRASSVPLDALDRSRRTSPKVENVSHSGASSGANFYGGFSNGIMAFRSQSKNLFGAGVSHPISSIRIAGIHVGRTAMAVEPTYGVGPVRGPDRDPKTKGSTPDDFRADDIHMAEPKEITKEKAAIAQEEPPDFQVQKMMPDWEAPVHVEADSQRGPGDKVFEGKTRKLQGTAQYEGDTTGTESGDKVEGQYGATPSEGKTSRA
ncbi:unnamed protein product [Calypogeia fissa]